MTHTMPYQVQIAIAFSQKVSLKVKLADLFKRLLLHSTLPRTNQPAQPNFLHTHTAQLKSYTPAQRLWFMRAWQPSTCASVNPCQLEYRVRLEHGAAGAHRLALALRPRRPRPRTAHAGCCPRRTLARRRSVRMCAARRTPPACDTSASCSIGWEGEGYVVIIPEMCRNR